MNRQLVVIGAGGHARVCSEIAELNGYNSIVFLDDGISDERVFGKTDCFPDFLETADFFVAIGNNKVRQAIYEKIDEKNGNIVSLVHPFAVVSKSASIGRGTVIMAGVAVNAGANIGNGVIINTCSSVDHDCNINDFAHIAVGAHLAGTVTVGEGSLVGAGATVLNNISICDGVTVGAGAAVIKPIEESGTYAGVPAVKIK